MSCVPPASSFSDFLPLARHSSSLDLILDHLLKSPNHRVLRANRKPVGHGDLLPFLFNTYFTKKETRSMW